LRLDYGVRKALMSLCSLLTLRFIHHTQSQDSTSTASATPSSVPVAEGASSVGNQSIASNDGEIAVVGTLNELKVCNDPNVLPPAMEGHSKKGSDPDYRWDDLREPFLSAALDEVIRCRTAARANSSNRGKSSRSLNPLATEFSQMETSHLPDKSTDSGSNEFLGPSDEEVTKNLEAIAAAGAGSPYMSALSRRTVTSLAQDDEDSAQRLNSQLPGRALAAAGPTRRVRKCTSERLQRSAGVEIVTNEQLVRNSIAAANAVELVKLILLNSGVEAPLSGILVEAVQHFKEAEIFTAVKYLRERGFLVCLLHLTI
jgi:hypothetical protein